MVHWEEIDDFNSGSRKRILINKEDLPKLTRAYRVISIHESVLVSTVEEYPYLALDFFKYYKAYSLQKALGLTLGYPPKCVEWFDLADHDRRVKVYLGSVGSLTFVFPETLMEYVKDYFAPVDVFIREFEGYTYRGAGTYLGKGD